MCRFPVKMVLRVVLVIALVVNICNAVPPSRSAPVESVCNGGDTKKKGCNDCYCLAGQWACSFKACYSAEEFTPGSLLCKLAPHVKGCRVTVNPDFSESQQPPTTEHEPKPNTEHQQNNSEGSSTAIIFPSSGGSEPPKRQCPPGAGQGSNRPSPGGENSTSSHRVEEQSEFDIDIRRPRPPSAKEPQPAEGDDERPPRCQDKTGTATGTATSGVSTLNNSRPRRPPPASSGDRRPPGGDQRKQGSRNKPGHRRPGPVDSVRRRPRPRAWVPWWLLE